MSILINLLFSLLIASNIQQQILPIPPEGTSLVVTADSLLLQSRHDYADANSAQPKSIFKDERLVLVQSERDAADTTQIWVELAQESRIAGWIKLQDLIRDTAPSGPISRLLHKALSPLGKFITSILALASLCLCVLLVRKRRSIYFSIAACSLFLMLVVFIICFSSGDLRLWNYYLNPTLWPFASFMPFLLRVLLLLFWANVVLWLAAIFSLRRDTYIVCTNCGGRLRHGSETCPRCGARNV